MTYVHWRIGIWHRKTIFDILRYLNRIGGFRSVPQMYRSFGAHPSTRTKTSPINRVVNEQSIWPSELLNDFYCGRFTDRYAESYRPAQISTFVLYNAHVDAGAKKKKNQQQKGLSSRSHPIIRSRLIQANGCINATHFQICPLPAVIVG